ncbi:MAG: hypothetical protein Q606_CBAC00026G0003 [Intestinibacter bartlettii DORA_8_9]|uniref:Immunity MXAN-0049 protein domain-containing protein n=1 Tax=Intestinibacter bartlettii TaxID=261299 RepID=A0A6N2ZW74_9FIRM|nr:MAG: hypothetical protein Q606_CBAC00026G0003 [Intestinibacter bartlettii DORA_8_9]
MKYYQLVYDHDGDDKKNNIYIMALFPNIQEDIDRYDIDIENEFITNWDINNEFGYDPKDGYMYSDCLANVYSWMIVSEKSKNIFDKYIHSNNLQLLPIKIKNIVSEQKTNYFVLHVMDVIDALDLEHSDYREIQLAELNELNEDENEDEYENETYLMIAKCALKKDIIKGHHIFKVKKNNIKIFVSEEIKNEIEKNNLVGFCFWEVMTY